MNRYYKWDVWLLWLCINEAVGFYHELPMKSFTAEHWSDEPFFGYSVTYQADAKRLIVGAPKSNIVGQVYSIDIDTNVLTALPTPQLLLERALHITSPIPSQKNFLLGLTVQAGSNFVVMCAPRTSQIALNLKPYNVVVLGRCFVSTTHGTIRPLDNDGIFSVRYMKPYGSSLHITAADEVIVGAPSMYEGIVKVVHDTFRELRSPQDMNGTGFGFGYSLTSGNYFDTDMTKLYYAVSTPVGTIGLGAVHFFNSNTLKKVYTIKSFTLNSMFGASLCTVSLGSRLDSLLIGAPTYIDDVRKMVYDRGAVYLYVPESETSTKGLVNMKIIEGQSDGAYFGYSIVNLGDMDADMKDEVAIGAPYEDNGRGAVYIYSGASLGDPNKNGNQMLIQRIQPEPNKKLASFGFSLTPLQDYDENGCNELAVGAPESNSVELYRCFSCIVIKLEPKFPTITQIKKNRQEDTYIFQSCVAVTFSEKPKHINEKIQVRVKIAHQDAWFITKYNTKTYEMTYEQPINKNQSEYCKDIKVITRNTGTIESLMSYEITASLLDDPKEALEFNSNRVRLCQKSVLSVVGKESLADCEGQCEPKLTIDFKPNMSNIYIIGSTSEGTFAFVIHNEGDTAYTACLLVKIKGAPLLRPPPGCTTENGEDLTCTPTTLLKKGQDWVTGDIALDTSGLTSKDELITVFYTLYNHCNNRNNPVEVRKETYDLISDVEGIDLRGESEPGDEVDVYSEALQSRHVYIITNSGPTNWEGVSAEIVMLVIKTVVYENIIVMAEDDRPVSCQIATSTEKQLYTNCYSINLKRNCTLKVIVPFVITPPADVIVASQNVSTSLNLKLKKYSLNSNVITQLKYKKSTVPLWIIIAASLIGLFLLLILGYMFFSFGFLDRKKKQDLKKLKRSVYSQSMIRQSMRNSKRENNDQEEDKQKIINEPTNIDSQEE